MLGETNTHMQTFAQHHHESSDDALQPNQTKKHNNPRKHRSRRNQPLKGNDQDTMMIVSVFRAWRSSHLHRHAMDAIMPGIHSRRIINIFREEIKDHEKQQQLAPLIREIRNKWQDVLSKLLSSSSRKRNAQQQQQQQNPFFSAWRVAHALQDPLRFAQPVRKEAAEAEILLGEICTAYAQACAIIMEARARQDKEEAAHQDQDMLVEEATKLLLVLA
jgi:hypothetical protein